MNWYKYNINDMSDADYDTFFAVMDSEKKARISRFKNIDDKKRSVSAEMLAKKAIAEKCGVSPYDVIFAVQEGGKPFCKNFDVQFNMSHSGDYAVCAVSERPIGIDIQKISVYSPKTAKKVCSEPELEAVEKSDDKAAEFIKLWTQKEAVLKMLGTGISGGIKTCLDGKTVKTFRFSDYFVSIYEEEFEQSAFLARLQAGRKG